MMTVIYTQMIQKKYIDIERDKANVAKMLTIGEFGGGSIIVVFFQLVRSFEIFQTKKLVEEKINTH